VSLSDGRYVNGPVGSRGVLHLHRGGPGRQKSLQPGCVEKFEAEAKGAAHLVQPLAKFYVGGLLFKAKGVKFRAISLCARTIRLTFASICLRFESIRSALASRRAVPACIAVMLLFKHVMTSNSSCGNSSIVFVLLRNVASPVVDLSSADDVDDFVVWSRTAGGGRSACIASLLLCCAIEGSRPRSKSRGTLPRKGGFYAMFCAAVGL
jgi:hypothetical protein